MNIIFLIGKLSFSGAENVLRSIAPEIAKRGHNVEIMVMYGTDSADDLSGVTVQLYGAEGNALQRRKKRYANIRKEAIRFKADVIVGFGFPMNFDAVMGAKGTNAVPVICERMDPYKSFQKMSFRIQKKFFYPMAKGYVVQTPQIKAYYEKHYSGKKDIAVIPNPVRQSYALSPKSDAKPEDYIITVGRLDDAQKNQSMLFRAFAETVKKYPSLRLKLAGSGKDLDKFVRTVNELGISENVDFLGNIKDPTDLVKHAKLFVLTSNHEGMPNALIEAMSLGKACLSTRCSGGGAEYLIDNGINGVLVDIDDDVSLSKEMNKVLSDEKYRHQLENNAFQINSTLKLDKIVDMWTAYLQKFLH